MILLFTAEFAEYAEADIYENSALSACSAVRFLKRVTHDDFS